MTTTETTDLTVTFRRKASRFVRAGSCGHGGCPFEVCVTFQAEGSSTTENAEAARFFRATVAALAEAAHDGRGSALLSLQEADDLLKDGKPTLALSWLLHSLEHSVGVFHPLTRLVAECVAASGHPLAASVARRFA